MLLAMYWGDSEEEKKKRLEEKLRLKKAKKKGEVPPPPVDPPLPPGDPQDQEIIIQTVGDFETQEMLEKNQSEMQDLKHLMVQQNKMLQQIMEKQDTPNYQVIHKPSAEEVRITEKDPSLPTLGELDVKVINTDGIETQGEAGQTKDGESIKDRAAQLRALKKKRGK